jgi:hypothetical protein
MKLAKRFPQLLGGEADLKVEAEFQAGANRRMKRIPEAVGLLILGVLSFE